MRKTKTLGDFFLGNRTIGPWVSAFAYGTTYFSAVLFIGFAGKLGWKFGLNVLWIAAGNAAIGSLAAWLVLGRRTRRMTQNLDTMTMPEFLEQRFGGRFVKVLAALVIFIFLLPYSASIFKGLGHLFQAVFNIDYTIALLIMIGITGVYLVLGGYFAITITDFFQGLIMLGRLGDHDRASFWERPAASPPPSRRRRRTSSRTCPWRRTRPSCTSRCSCPWSS